MYDRKGICECFPRACFCNSNNVMTLSCSRESGVLDGSRLGE